MTFFLHQVGLLGVRTAVDDFLGVGGADTGKRVELLFGGAVDVDEIGRGSGSRLFARWSWFAGETQQR